jgi:hypothetical protein
MSAATQASELCQPPVDVLSAVNLLTIGVGPGPDHYKLARYAVEGCKYYDPQRPYQTALLAKEIWLQLRHLFGHVWLEAEKSDDQLGMLPADAFAADYLEAMGSTGAQMAEGVRLYARKRWSERASIPVSELWYNWHGHEFTHDIFPVASAVAVAAWEDIVKKKLEAKGCPAISAAVLDAAVTSLWQGPGNTLWCHRVFRWLVNAAFVQSHASEPEGRIQVVHGLQGLVGRLTGKPSRSRIAQLGQALTFMAGSEATMPTGATDGWLEFKIRAAAPHRPALLTIQPHDALTSHYVNPLPKRTHSQRQARMLVPVPHALPPLVGRGPDHAGQCTFQMLLLAEFRAQAMVLEERGAIAIGNDKLGEMAARAGVSRSLACAALEASSDRALPGGPLWLRGGSNLITMGGGLAFAEEFIRQAAVKQREGLRVQQQGRKRLGHRKIKVAS